MLIGKNKLLEWRKEKKILYLGKPIWKKTYGQGYSKKMKAYKHDKAHRTDWWNKNERKAVQDEIKFSKKYPIYDNDTNQKLGTVTDLEIEDLKKKGITVLAEKDGFKC